jgi:hypothetical protein
VLESSRQQNGRVLVVVDPLDPPRLRVVLDVLTLKQRLGGGEEAAPGQ